MLNHEDTVSFHDEDAGPAPGKPMISIELVSSSEMKTANSQSPGSISIPVTNYRSTNLRWMALVLASFLVFGNDYCYDLPQAMQVHIEEDFGVSEVQYNLLYSVYSIPNIFLPFVGGYILDYFGMKFGIMLYNLLLLVGQGLFTLGSFTGAFSMLVFGRAVFGIGAESLNVAQSTIVNVWFKGRELSTALGISLCVCRLGSSLTSYLSPILYEKYESIGVVSAISILWLVLSFICGIGLINMDNKYLKGEAIETEKIRLSDIKSLNLGFWFLYVNALLSYMAFFSFLNIANKYLQEKFSYSQTTAGALLIIPYGLAGVLTPILSYQIDKHGKKATLLIITCSLLAFTHFYMAETEPCYQCFSSILPLILYGIFFALYTSLLISSVSVILDEKIIGTGLGIIISGQNTGLAIGPLIVGEILSGTGDVIDEYTTMSKTLGLFALLATIFAVLSWWFDQFKNKSILQKSMKELASHAKSKEEENKA